MLDRIASIPRSFTSTDRTRLSPLAYLFLVMLCVAFFTPGLVTMPPTDRDESLYAQASKQMIESGNYTDIRFQDEARYKKPIGIYWLQSAAVRLLNPQHLDEIWAYRIPSLIGATVAVLATAALGGLLFSPAAGLLAAMMLAGCALLNGEARLATTDAVLLACVNVAMYGLAKARLASERLSPGAALAFWLAVAGGFLVKGPIVLLPVVSALLWLKVSEKKIGWVRFLRPAVGIPLALALVAPWFIAISLQSHGAFLQQSAGQDMLAKIWQGQNRGALYPGFHLILLPLLFFPFSIFIVLALPDVWKNRQDPAVRFCLGWIIPTWLVFEISLTKLPHYELPTYPALALLAAKFLGDGFPTLAASARRLPTVLIVATWIMIGMAVTVAAFLLPALGDHSFVPMLAGIALVIAQSVALFLMPKQKTGSLIVLTIGSLIFITAVFSSALPALRHVWLSKEIVEAVEGVESCPHNQIVSVGYEEPSLVFLAGTDTILAKSAAAAAEFLRQGPCRVAVVDADHQQDFLAAFAKAPKKPREAGNLQGLDAGRGKNVALTLYTLSAAAWKP